MLSWMAAIFAALLGTDVMCKQQVEENLEPGEIRELFGGKVLIRKVYNRGFMLNLLDDRPGIIKGATMITGAGILIWDALVFLKKGNALRKLGLTVLSAGAASNAFDRLARGKVIDYIGIPGKNRFLARITANLGDLYIACGGIFIMISDLLRK